MYNRVARSVVNAIKCHGVPGSTDHIFSNENKNASETNAPGAMPTMGFYVAVRAELCPLTSTASRGAWHTRASAEHCQMGIIMHNKDDMLNICK